MNINYKQPQFELFPANSATLEDVNKPRFLLANLTLSIETLVIFTILGIMLGLFSFSLGVERGKRLAASALDEKVSAAWNLAPHRPVMPAAAAVPVSLVNRAVSSNYQAQAKPVLPQATEKPAALMPAGRFAIQTGTFKNETYAKDEALKLKAKGMPSFLIKKGNFWVLCVGPFTSAENAHAFLNRTKSKLPGSSVRRF